MDTHVYTITLSASPSLALVRHQFIETAGQEGFVSRFGNSSPSVTLLRTLATISIDYVHVIALKSVGQYGT